MKAILCNISLIPSKVHDSKNSNMSYERAFLRYFITTFVIDVSHCQVKILPFKNNFLREKNFSLERIFRIPYQIKRNFKQKFKF